MKKVIPFLMMWVVSSTVIAQNIQNNNNSNHGN